MNEKQYRTYYTPEFKLEALEQLRTSGKSAAQIERDLGITSGLLPRFRLTLIATRTGATGGSQPYYPIFTRRIGCVRRSCRSSFFLTA